jgi:hypothetical protein
VRVRGRPAPGQAERVAHRRHQQVSGCAAVAAPTVHPTQRDGGWLVQGRHERTVWCGGTFSPSIPCVAL